jgi:hypothetical protein
VWDISSGCFLAADRELMQRFAEGKTQKHQNRPGHWRCFVPEMSPRENL